MKALEVTDLSFSYLEDKPLLQNISFSLEEGEIFCLLGPNGSGKTTLMRQILFAGNGATEHIRLYGKPLTRIPRMERSRLLGYVPQKLMPLQISVLQTVLMGRYPCSGSWLLKPDQKDLEIAMDAIDQMGLTKLADRQLGSLSGGEMQRVFIAQSLAKQAKIYFFDEPMSALDPQYQAEFLLLMRWLTDRGAAVLFTTHNPNHLLSLADAKVGILNDRHTFRTIGRVTRENVDVIEETFHNSVKIAYSEYHGGFASVFRLQAEKGADNEHPADT